MSVTVSATTSPTPQASNYGGMKGSVAAYVQGQNLASVVSDSGLALNSAIDKINTRNWHWLEKQTTITLTADTKTYTVPADFKRPRKFHQLDVNSKIADRYQYMIPKVFLDADWDDSTSGTPRFYTVRNATDDRLLTLNVAPSAGHVAKWPTGRLHYFSRLNYFASDGDTMGTIEAPPEARNFLIWYGRWEIASMRGSSSQVSNAKSAWVAAWLDLMKDDTNLQTDWHSGGLYR